MSKNFGRAIAARTVASCLLTAALAACNTNQVTLARPAPRSAHVSQGLSSGYTGTATFDAPVVNPNTWQGTPIGTGSYATTATPPVSGGPQAIGFYDSSASPTLHYLIVGNLGAGAGHFFGIVSDGQALSLGTSTINNTSLYAGIFDAATGDPVALASSGTITLTAAGLVGGRITGSFSGTLDDVVNTGCTSSAQCQSGEQCINGTCIRTGCTSNAQCATGQTCQGGQCVATPQCTTHAQCGAGMICQAGTCVPAPGCTSNAQCAAGQVCQAGACVPSTPTNCSGQQGGGSYTGKTGASAVCSVLAPSASVTHAVAAIGDDGNGGLALYVMDPNRDSAGLVLPLTACPGVTGTVAISGASFWDQSVSGSVTYYAVQPVTSASVTFTKVGARTAGDFTASLSSGGWITGAFDVQ